MLEALTLRQGLHFFALLLCGFHVGRALVFLDRNVNQRCRQLGLLLGALLGLVQLALFVRSDLLLREGFHLLAGNLPVAQLIHDVLDLVVTGLRFGRAYEHFLEFQRIRQKAFTHVDARIGLQFGARLDEFNESVRLAHVLEIARHHRVERLLDELFHIAKALHHHRRFAVVDVHDNRQRQLRLERIFGDERDFAQIAVEAGTTRAALPHQDEVGGRHQFDLAGVGVEGVFAWHQRVAPDAAAAALHEFAVAVFTARHVLAFAPRVRHHHADKAHRNDGLGNEFHRGEKPVDVVRAFDQHTLLPAAAASGVDEGLGLLERVVAIADIGRQQLIALQRRAVLHRHHGELV